MAFSKTAITLIGANYILDLFDIEIIELPTGGYRAIRDGEIVTEDRVLKIATKNSIKIAAQNFNWLKESNTEKQEEKK